MAQPRFIIRYFQKGTSGLDYSPDTEIEVVGAITLGNLPKPINLEGHFGAAQTLEDYIDTLVYNKIKEDYPGYYLTPRFSPGYGLLLASDNKKFLDLVKCDFIVANEAGALYPQYSVVFAVGLSKKKQPDHTKCELCNTKNCQFRRR